MPSGATGARDIFLGQNFIQYCPSTGPTSGTPAQVGDIAIANPPIPGYPSVYQYINSTVGWVGVGGSVEAGTYANTAAAAVPGGYAFYNFSPGGYAATLSSPATLASSTRFNAFASAAVTLSALTGSSITGSTTLAAGSVSEFVSNGTVWYRVV